MYYTFNLGVPILLPFHPYTSEEIALIIKSRLPDQENSIFTPNAIELLSKKLVGLGDIRKTLDICLKSIEKMESDDKKSIVDFNHVLAVTKSTIGNTNTSINKIKELNFHVQVCLVSCFRGSINNVRSVGSITDCYYKFVKMGKVGGISRNEFGVVLTVLEGLGLIILGNAKEERERLVELCVSEEEVREGCRGHEKALFYMDVKI